jgi:hypothetical protein
MGHSIMNMKRTTQTTILSIACPEAMKHQLRDEAVRRGTSVSDIVRRAVAGYFAQPQDAEAGGCTTYSREHAAPNPRPNPSRRRNPAGA